MASRENVVPVTTELVWQSRDAGDIVLATLPPYMAMGWLAMGVPLLSALLEQAGMTSRIVRFGDVPHDAPPDILELQDMTLWSDPPLADRLERIRGAAERNPAFFELVITRLLAGGERVLGFSIWRLNVDVTLEVTRRIKELRPDVLIVVGGPETAEAPEDLQQPWIDVVVRGAAESVVVPVIRALCDGQPAEAGGWENVWVNAKHGARRSLLLRRGETPPLPRIDYTRIVPLQVGAPLPSIPVLLNLGCPFRCRFCTNTTIYPVMSWGDPQRVVSEMLEIMQLWKDLHPHGAAPPLEITFCDAALNAQPSQFDELCERMIAADWPLRPSAIMGQIIVDGRMTAERIKLAMGARLDHTFFGLESASPRVRRAMKKPGKREEIARALELCKELGWERGLNTGIVVGWPDETEEEFYETIEFLDWAVSLGVIRALSLMPMYRTQGMMDDNLLRGAEGEAKGLAWRLPTPAGSPAVRARRYFHVFEHFSGFIDVQSPVPHHVVVRTMLSEHPSTFWDRWITRHGEHPVDNRSQARPERTAIASSVSSSPLHVGLAEPNRTAGPEEPSEPNAWQRTLVGRGNSVVLRLNPDTATPSFARIRAHGLSYLGDTLPASLRDVVHDLGRAVRGLPEQHVPTEQVWIEVGQFLNAIAADVRLD